MTIASADDIPAIDAALAHLNAALRELSTARDTMAREGRGHITVRLSACEYLARREIEGMRDVLVSLRRAWQAEQGQAEIAAARGRQR